MQSHYVYDGGKNLSNTKKKYVIIIISYLSLAFLDRAKNRCVVVNVSLPPRYVFKYEISISLHNNMQNTYAHSHTHTLTHTHKKKISFHPTLMFVYS